MNDKTLMSFRNLGNSNRIVSRIGLGLAALGRPGYINLGHQSDLQGKYDPALMAEQACEVLQSAWEAGITYFDAARSYGKAEEFLSSWLRNLPMSPHAVVVGSKWGYEYTANWQVEADVHEEKQHSIQRLQKQWPESQQLLGEYLDLYQIHSATLESGVLQDQAVLSLLNLYKQAGMLIGLSVTGPRQSDVIAAALDVEMEGRRLFDTIQVTWNLLEQSCSKILSQAHAQGVGIIVKEAVANGRLTARNDQPGFREKQQKLARLAAEHQVGIDAIAIAGVLAQPWADVVLSGAARCEHLMANLQALKVKLSAEDLLILQELPEVADDYWQTRSQLQWN